MALPSSVRQSPIGSAASAVPLTIVVATRVTIARRMVPPVRMSFPGPVWELSLIPRNLEEVSGNNWTSCKITLMFLLQAQKP
jgi:hypothetical protein